MKMNDLEKHIKKVFEREETMNLLYELLRSEIGQTHEILAKAIWTEKQTGSYFDPSPAYLPS